MTTLSSMRAQWGLGLVLVRQTESVDHRRAGLVQAEDLDFGAIAPKLDHRLVESAYRRDVPEVGQAYVYDHPLDHLTEIEGFKKPIDRREEHLPLKAVGAGRPVIGEL